jgi:hypothetical protein
MQKTTIPLHPLSHLLPHSSRSHQRIQVCQGRDRRDSDEAWLDPANRAPDPDRGLWGRARGPRRCAERGLWCHRRAEGIPTWVILAGSQLSRSTSALAAPPGDDRSAPVRADADLLQLDADGLRLGSGDMLGGNGAFVGMDGRMGTKR